MTFQQKYPDLGRGYYREDEPYRVYPCPVALDWTGAPLPPAVTEKYEPVQETQAWYSTSGVTTPAKDALHDDPRDTGSVNPAPHLIAISTTMFAFKPPW
jgi:hypothetical protein